MVRTRSSIRSITETVFIFNIDTLESIASFLDCHDLANLSKVSKKFEHSVNEVVLRILSSLHARYGGDDLYPLEELHYLLRSPLEFDDLLGDRIGYVRIDDFGEDRACVYSSNPNTLHTPYYIAQRTMEGAFNGWDGSEQTAICSKYVMTSGKHYAKFTISTCDPLLIFRYVYCRLGIMRPIDSEWRNGEYGSFCPLTSPWSNNLLGQKTQAWGESNKHCCLYYDFQGTCEWGDWTANIHGVHVDQQWNGMEGFDIYDGELGLLLDLDEGTLSVYKNGTRLGVMMDGLTGEYCWVAQIIAQAHGDPEEQNVRIQRAHIPY